MGNPSVDLRAHPPFADLGPLRTRGVLRVDLLDRVVAGLGVCARRSVALFASVPHPLLQTGSRLV